MTLRHDRTAFGTGVRLPPPPGNSPHRNALCRDPAAEREGRSSPSLAAVTQQVTELGNSVERDEVRDGVPSLGASGGHFALRFSKRTGLRRPRPEPAGHTNLGRGSGTRPSTKPGDQSRKDALDSCRKSSAIAWRFDRGDTIRPGIPDEIGIGSEKGEDGHDIFLVPPKWSSVARTHRKTREISR